MIFLGSAAVADGILTPAQLRSSAWRPLFHDVYADAKVPVTHQQRCLAVDRFILPDGGALAGRSAAHLYGAVRLDDRAPVEVIVNRSTRLRGAGLRVHQTPFADEEIQTYAGLRLTTPLRTCWDLAQWLDPVEAVAIVDALAAGGRLQVDDVAEHARALAGTRGWRRLHRVAGLVDPAAESPQESRLRVRLVPAGVPRPVSQYIIEESGRRLARTDLAWPEYRLAMEYDGLWHAGSQAQIHADRQRLNRLVSAGWLVLFVTSRRLREDFDGIVAELRAALRARRPR